VHDKGPWYRGDMQSADSLLDFVSENSERRGSSPDWKIISYKEVTEAKTDVAKKNGSKNQEEISQMKRRRTRGVGLQMSETSRDASEDCRYSESSFAQDGKLEVWC